MSTTRRPLGTGPRPAPTDPASAAGAQRLPADIDPPAAEADGGDEGQAHVRPARRVLGRGGRSAG